MSDSIYIRDLVLPVVIGTNPEERLAPQNLTFNLELSCDLSKAGNSDDLADTVDYFTLCERMTALISASSFYLLERLAEAIAELSLSTDGVTRVSVTIEKPNVLPNARSAAVRIVREHR